MQPNQIILASGNQKKLKELSEILKQFTIELVPQSNFVITEAVEDGLTFVENAIKKARHACEIIGKPAIADDSGIEVDCLGGSPGIYSARFAGEHATDSENLNKLITNIKATNEIKPNARYQCVIVYMRHAKDPTPLITQASWEGVLLEQPLGNGGFGYDPIFYCPSAQKTAAQMTMEEKAQLSHRGKALALFQQAFQQRYINNSI
ncbi:RdgB/HAM1 family non-canonical purine NTP pyrophosphatase [Aliikangiella sp. IMCC44359]|uniref:RdgB/HAM1 family non-canonical purine NTP pyrophosphatase n=1 Tax=Aliikangiella sp. IMCC44359 TaxID=3459125 RepID=UPI00403ADC06